MDGRPRVLIVEDQASVRASLAELMGTGPGGWGFAVTAVATIGEALAALSGESFDLAVIDYRLGGDHTGDRVAKEIRIGWPACGVLIWTGYATGRMIAELAPWSITVVDKGDIERLRREIARMIAAQPSRETRKILATLGYPVGARDVGMSATDNIAMITVDEGFAVRWMNPLAADVLGYDYDATPEHELYSIDLSGHVPPEFRAAHAAWVAQFFSDRSPARIMAGRRIPLLRRGGERIDAEIVLIPTPVIDVLYVTALILLPPEGRHGAAAGDRQAADS